MRTLDLNKPPPRRRSSAPRRRPRLDAVASMPDTQIDYSDAPGLLDAVWMNAATALSHAKKQITLRIDAPHFDTCVVA